MRVILREDVDKVGNAGEVVLVRDGFGRNYLLPKGLASLATDRDVARVEHERRVIAARNARLLKDLEAASEKLASTTISVGRAVGEGDRLYGSVTSRDIAEALQAKGFDIDSRKVVLSEPIKALGAHDVKVKLGKGVEAQIKVWVVKESSGS